MIFQQPIDRRHQFQRVVQHHVVVGLGNHDQLTVVREAFEDPLRQAVGGKRATLAINAVHPGTNLVENVRTPYFTETGELWVKLPVPAVAGPRAGMVGDIIEHGRDHLWLGRLESEVFHALGSCGP